MNHILKIGFTIFLTFISLLMYSQQTYYNKSWDVHGSDWKADVLKHKGYYYTVGGSTFYSGTQWVFGMTMEKLDSLGNSVKYKEISDTSFAINASNYSSLVVSPTGSIYKVGYGNMFKNNKKIFSAYLYKTNTNLDSIFFKTYPPDTGKIRVFENAIYYDHHIYAVGTDSIYGKSYQMMLMKLDTLGNVVWEKKYISPGTGMVGTCYGYEISKTADNGFVLFGQYNKNITLYNYDLRVLKLDSNGTQEWAKIVYKMPVESGSNDPSLPSFVLGTSDGNILVGAEMPETRFYMKLNLLKFDLQGNQLWRRKYGFIGDSQLMYITDAIEDKYGNYDILINESFLNSHLLKVSPSGDSLRMTGFGIWGNRALSSVNSNPSFGNSLVKEDDGGYTVVGSYIVAGTLHDNWIARIDSNGCNMHGTPYNVTATPIQYNGKSAMKIEWQDSIVNPSRKYSIEVRAVFTDAYTQGYYGKNNFGLVSGYSYIDTAVYIIDTIPNIKIHSYRVRAVDSITNNVSCASEMAYILNISENKELQEIEAKFYPNPAKEFFFVEILNPEKEQITLTMHNLLGEQIKTQQFSAGYLKEQINTKHLSKGIYIVSLQSQSGKLLKQSKVVVQ